MTKNSMVLKSIVLIGPLKLKQQNKLKTIYNCSLRHSHCPKSQKTTKTKLFKFMTKDSMVLKSLVLIALLSLIFLINTK